MYLALSNSKAQLVIQDEHVLFLCHWDIVFIYGKFFLTKPVPSKEQYTNYLPYVMSWLSFFNGG